MPMPRMPSGFEWTEDDIQTARRRGKRLALEHRDAGGTPPKFDGDEAWDLMEAEDMFQDKTENMRRTMAIEMSDAYERFARELREVAA